MSRLSRRRWCSGAKVKHADQAGAELHRDRLDLENQRRGRTRPGKRLAVYWCEPCQSYHVGNEPADVQPASK